MSYLRLNSEPGVIFSFLRVDFKKMSAQWENEGKIIFAFLSSSKVHDLSEDSEMV